MGPIKLQHPLFYSGFWNKARDSVVETDWKIFIWASMGDLQIRDPSILRDTCSSQFILPQLTQNQGSERNTSWALIKSMHKIFAQVFGVKIDPSKILTFQTGRINLRNPLTSWQNQDQMKPVRSSPSGILQKGHCWIFWGLPKKATVGVSGWVVGCPRSLSKQPLLVCDS